jgi:protein-S-isoprenylcysteine O-methyltransferase Ste14
MKNSNLPGLSPLWLISLALVLGTLIAVLIPISIATSIKPSDWIGFAGSVVAGAITLLAAILAWFAVQRQITAQEEAEKRAAERAEERHAVEMSNAKGQQRSF